MSGLLFKPATNFGGSTPPAGAGVIMVLSVSESSTLEPDQDNKIIFANVYDSVGDVEIQLSSAFAVNSRVGICCNIAERVIVRPPAGQSIQIDGEYSTEYIETTSSCGIVWLTYTGILGWTAEVAKGIWLFNESSSVYQRVINSYSHGNIKALTTQVPVMSNPPTENPIVLLEMGAINWPSITGTGRLAVVEFEIYLFNTGGQGSFGINLMNLAASAPDLNGYVQLIDGTGSMVEAAVIQNTDPGFTKDATDSGNFLYKGRLVLTNGTGGVGNMQVLLSGDNLNYFQQVIALPGSYIKWWFDR